MPQNLPIQGPQVQEIQGGMRLTPLGLGQLSSDSNAVSAPNGIVPALADPGDGNTTTAAARPPGVPVQFAIDVPDTANSITTHYATPVGLTGTTADLLVTGVRTIKQGGNGHGSGTNTITVRNNSTSGAAITNVEAYTSDVDTVVTVLNIDDANALVLSGTALVISLVKDGGGNSAHRVIVDGLSITRS